MSSDHALQNRHLADRVGLPGLQAQDDLEGGQIYACDVLKKKTATRNGAPWPSNLYNGTAVNTSSAAKTISSGELAWQSIHYPQTLVAS